MLNQQTIDKLHIMKLTGMAEAFAGAISTAGYGQALLRRTFRAHR